MRNPFELDGSKDAYVITSVGTEWLQGSEGPMGSERKAAEWLANEGGLGQVRMGQRDVYVHV